MLPVITVMIEFATNKLLVDLIILMQIYSLRSCLSEKIIGFMSIEERHDCINGC
jgi:hypothetical protein